MQENNGQMLKTGMLRGFNGRCPHCGRGRLFARFLKVTDRCSECGEEFHHHRADDFPPYLVIIAVGHFFVPFVFYVQAEAWLPLWAIFALSLPLTIGLSLVLLQPTKGAVVAMQWHLGMHGFSGRKGLHGERA